MSTGKPAPDASRVIPVVTELSKPSAKAVVALGTGIALIYFAFMPPAVHTVDEHSMLAVAESLVTGRGFAVEASEGRLGPDGRYYSPWYPLLSVVATPLVVVGLAAARLAGVPGHHAAAVFALILPALLTAATAALVMNLALRLGAPHYHAWLAGIGYAFSTNALAYSRTLYAEPLLTFLTVSAICATVTGTNRAIALAAVLSALCVLAKPTGCIVGLILALYLCTRRLPLRRACLPILGTLVGTTLYLAYNQIRFGSPLSSGVPWMFTPSVFVGGVLTPLVSPGQGIAFFCPPVLLACAGARHVVRRAPLEMLLIVALFVGYLLPYAFWDQLSGYTWMWGSRYLLPTLPGLLVLAALSGAAWTRWLVALVVAGFLVNAPTMVSFYVRYYAEATEAHVPPRALLWSPAYSPLTNGWAAAYRQIQSATHTDVRGMVQQAGVPDTLPTANLFRIVAVWWWMLPAFGLPRWPGVCIALMLLALGITLLVRSASASRSVVLVGQRAP